MQSVELAITEMQFARKELGFRGGFIRPNPYNNKMIHHPDYEPFWQAAENLDFSIGFHEGGNSAHADGRHRPLRGPRRAAHHQSHDGDDARLHERDLGRSLRAPPENPRRLSRIRRWLDRPLARPAWTAISTTRVLTISGLVTRPSELFQRNCWISFEPVEGSLKVLADYIGPHKIMWATDYPHRDGFFPGAPKMILDQLADASPETRCGVMAGGAMGFYGLN